MKNAWQCKVAQPAFPISHYKYRLFASIAAAALLHHSEPLNENQNAFSRFRIQYGRKRINKMKSRIGFSVSKLVSPTSLSIPLKNIGWPTMSSPVTGNPRRLACVFQARLDAPTRTLQPAFCYTISPDHAARPGSIEPSRSPSQKRLLFSESSTALSYLADTSIFSMYFTMPYALRRIDLRFASNSRGREE